MSQNSIGPSPSESNRNTGTKFTETSDSDRTSQQAQQTLDTHQTWAEKIAASPTTADTLIRNASTSADDKEKDSALVAKNCGGVYPNFPAICGLASG